MKVLVTGGAGYIGSHTALELLNRGDEVVIIDNFANSSCVALKRLAEICGRKPVFYEGDVKDKLLLRRIFSEQHIDSIIHFAGLKSVSESIKKPLEYYENNIVATVDIVDEAAKANVKNFIFSSSATVYGDPEVIPISELNKTGGTTNPYGTSKLFAEKILQDYAAANKDFNITILRYFNPVGAHVSGKIGEDPNGVPNNLVPYVSKVAVGKYEYVSIFGNDYKTKDGTGIRDYIHVTDLAKGHLAALDHIGKFGNIRIYNLGTGNGYSVLDVINSFQRISGVGIKYQVAPRRNGDVAECWSDPSLALAELKWRAELSLDDMLKDTWKWQTLNPNGYN
ncbi:UDP-glucose 4-epimerase GalE [Cedecea colo]|uniref:UDP-glucose 4-epimerase n=1 Tax=Cedecea colo TaxID=2552946 RepID=A0ABX0VGK7_9ENTR|nr:UDP-glucose 4-epimerase GalE [Cedecea colo]NIY46208.1 UDP-glucose 4-epimerase GalE [Cedecea colo]